jgi:protein involved in polysaccharide export with SLBB domain
VAILGQVNKEGNYTLLAGARLSSVIAEAGGFTETAEPTKVKVVRQGQQEYYDLTPLMRGEALPKDPEVRDGDLVVVPDSQHRVLVLGCVKKPGSYPFKPGDRVLDVLAAAEWVDVKGAANRAAFVRPIGENKMAWSEISLILAAQYGDMKHNPTLQNGDMIFVPPVSERTLAKYLQLLYPVAALYNAVTP